MRGEWKAWLTGSRRVLRAAARQLAGDGEHGVLVPGEHHRVGPVHRRDADHATCSGEQGRDLVLGGLDGDHRAAAGQVPHQPAARGDQLSRLGQGQDSGHVRGGDLADRVAGEEVGPHAPGLDEPEQRGLQGEQRALRVPGLVEQLTVGREDHLAQGACPGQVAFHGGARGVERRAEDRERLGQLTSHARPLAALTGEEDGQLARDRGAGHDRGTRATTFDLAEVRAELIPVGRQDDRPVVEVGTGRGERVGCVGEGQLRTVVEETGEPAGLAAQPGRGPRRHENRHRRTGRFRLRRGDRGLVGGRLEDDVCVGAADAERRHPGPAGAAGLRPVAGLGQQLHGTGRPVHIG